MARKATPAPDTRTPAQRRSDELNLRRVMAQTRLEGAERSALEQVQQLINHFRHYADDIARELNYYQHPPEATIMSPADRLQSIANNVLNCTSNAERCALTLLRHRATIEASSAVLDVLACVGTGEASE